MPLPKVTIRASGSSCVSTTNPGTSRVCRAPISRIAAQTSSGRALVSISLRMEAMARRLLPGIAQHVEPEVLVGDEDVAAGIDQHVFARHREPLRQHATPLLRVG